MMNEQPISPSRIEYPAPPDTRNPVGIGMEFGATIGMKLAFGYVIALILFYILTISSSIFMNSSNDFGIFYNFVEVVGQVAQMYAVIVGVTLMLLIPTVFVCVPIATVLD
jgi:hypothetical protein